MEEGSMRERLVDKWQRPLWWGRQWKAIATEYRTSWGRMVISRQKLHQELQDLRTTLGRVVKEREILKADRTAYCNLLKRMPVDIPALAAEVQDELEARGDL